MHARAYGAIFFENRYFGTTHGEKPTSQNGISLRSPSLIMAPGLIYNSCGIDVPFSEVNYGSAILICCEINAKGYNENVCWDKASKFGMILGLHIIFFNGGK